MPILPLSAMFFMALKGFVYTIAVDVYAFRLAFSIKMHCVLRHIALYFAINSPKVGANGGLFK